MMVMTIAMMALMRAQTIAHLTVVTQSNFGVVTIDVSPNDGNAISITIAVIAVTRKVVLRKNVIPAPNSGFPSHFTIELFS